MAPVFGRAEVARLERVYVAPEIVEQRARTRAIVGGIIGATREIARFLFLARRP